MDNEKVKVFFATHAVYNDFTLFESYLYRPSTQTLQPHPLI